MTEASPYVHLHVHSEYSILDGACRIAPLVARAADLGMPAIGLTDHGSMAGAVELTRVAHKAGLRPVLGCEVYLVDDHAARPLREKRAHLTLLAETTEGYHNLIRLVSSGFLDGYWYKPRVDFDQLASHADGIIALSGCLSGRVCKALIEDDPRAAREELDRLVQIFGRDDTYVEIQDGGIDAQTRILPALMALARDAGLPMVGTGDVHYLTRDDAIPHEALLCIQTQDTLDNPDRFRFSNHEFYLKSPQEMYALMAERFGEETVRRTVEIAERCNADVGLGAMHLPRFDVPEGISAVAYLRQLAERGLRERYQTETPELRSRLEFELKTIEEMGFADYFLIVWDFIRFAREDGVAVGPGRGSAAGSLVAYCLRITDLDPMRYSLLFERFLNPGRKSMPDIDIDFAVAGRERVINYVAEKYGRRNVAQIITFGKMQPKAAIKDAGRVMGIAYGQVDRIAKLVPDGPKVSFDECMKPGAELRKSYDSDETTRSIVDMARPLEGVVRNDSIHAAAVVIGDRPLTEYLPLQQKGSDSEIVTQFPMNDVEALGLLKMDFLGLRNLDVIDRAVALIEQSSETPPAMDALPLDDARTYQMLARGDATGVFQFESSGMREALRQVRPTRFEDLVALVALYRPGPMQNIPKFAARKAGREPVQYADERIENILHETFGICLTGDSLVVDVRTGRRVRLDQVDPESGVLVQGVDPETWSPAVAPVTHLMDNGVRPVFELELRGGARLRATANHEFLTEAGWRRLDELLPGDFVGTPNRQVAEDATATAEQIARMRVLGYLLGDGSLRNGSVAFYNSSAELRRSFREAVLRGFGAHTIVERQRARGVVSVEISKPKGSPARYHSPCAADAWLRELGMRWTQTTTRKTSGLRSEEKFVPECVFESGNEAIAVLLAALWDCDGHVASNAAFLKTISGRMARDVKSLLLRLGISSRIYTSEYETGAGHSRTAYQVSLYDMDCFQSSIVPHMRSSKRHVPTNGSPGGGGLIDRSLVRAEALGSGLSLKRMQREAGLGSNSFAPDMVRRHPRIKQATVQRIQQHVQSDLLARLCAVTWDEVIAIRPAGSEAVYDITVEGIHSFVANDIIVHNCVYQEQSMTIARELAGFSPAEADDLRKAIGKKIRSLMDSLKDKFIDGCLANGISQEVALQLWDDNERSSDYAFNKAHAACYALIAYRTAWLKANHPAEYMAALISSVMSTKDRVPFYVAECESMGIDVLPPDVNSSQSDFAVVDGRIRFGLTAVKRVGEGAVRAIVSAREASPFTSIWDFCERVDASALNKGMLESLVCCGALDSTGATRRAMMVVLEPALSSGVKQQSDTMMGHLSIFDIAGDDDGAGALAVRSHPAVIGEEWPRAELLAREKEALGLFVSSHPLADVREQLSRRSDVPLSAADSLRDGQVVTVGGLVTGVKPFVTRKGDRMAFAEIDDSTGSIEVVVFANTLAAVAHILVPDAVVMVKGRADRKNEGEVKLVALEITAFEATADFGVVRLRLDARATPAAIIQELKSLIGEFPGDAPVVLEVQTTDGPKTLRFGPEFKVRPDGDFFAEAKALLGDAALIA